MVLHDCVVIGAGLAGLRVALELGRRGRRVLLVDRKPTLTVGVHTTGIFVRRTLESFDLPADCLGPVIRSVSLHSPALRGLHLESPYAEFRVGRMRRLYSELLNQCRAAGVATALNTRFQSAEECGHFSRVRLRTELRSWTVNARYLVGADGAASQVAEQLGLGRNRDWIVGVEDVYRGVPLAGPPRMHCLLDPRLAPGYIAWAVNDGEEVHVGVGGYPSQFDPASALAEWTRSAGGLVDLSRSEKVERRGGRIPVGGVLPHLSSRYGLLVGDAAGAVSPLTAGGLDPCLRLSTFAAEVLEEALSTSNPEVLSQYRGTEFRTRFRGRLWLRSILRHCRSRLLAEAACWMLRTRPGRALASRVFFEPASFPDLPSRAPSIPLVAARGLTR